MMPVRVQGILISRQRFISILPKIPAESSVTPATTRRCEQSREGDRTVAAAAAYRHPAVRHKQSQEPQSEFYFPSPLQQPFPIIICLETTQKDCTM